MKVSFQTIIIGFLITLIIHPHEINAQKKNDSYIYSTVIDSLINQWNTKISDRDEIVLINKFKPSENYAENVISLLFDNDTILKREKIERNEKFANQFYYTTNGRYDFDCNGEMINNNDDIKQTIEILKVNFYDTPYLKEIKYKINRKYYLISSFRCKLFFKCIFGDRISKGWKRFYKKFPKSVGYFQFSEIAYNKNYACFYMERHTNGLSASGDIIIMKFENMIWKQIAEINLWVS